MDNKSLLDLMNRRQSVRAYLDKPVEKEKLLRCIEAARIAPSASNAQPWKYIVIDDQQLKIQVAELVTSKMIAINRFAVQAPIIIAVVQERANFSSNIGQTLKNREFPLIDIGISTMQFCLQATAEGLGTCILGWFNEKQITKVLGIPRTKRIALLITLGYASNSEIRRKIRKETNEILSYNGY
jgi:nitroreductase